MVLLAVRERAGEVRQNAYQRKSGAQSVGLIDSASLAMATCKM